MLGYIKDSFVYIKCPKNGCMTYSRFLESHGWQEINLFENTVDLSKCILWGHLTEPHYRHTRGVEQFLKVNPDIDYKNPEVAKLLVSGVFDEHGYSLSMMLGKIMQYSITWIPLDAVITKFNKYPTPIQHLTGDDITNEFFKEHGLAMHISLEDRLHVSTDKTIRKYIAALKDTYHENYQKLVKNFLEPDLILYNTTLAHYRKKYELDATT